MSENSFSGANAFAQFDHFSGHADARLNQGNVVMFVHRPHAERDSKLAVVTERASMDGYAFRQKRCNPLFHSGFPVAPSDGQDRSMESVALSEGQVLQCENDIGNDQNITVLCPTD